MFLYKILRLKRRISQYEHQIFELALRPPKTLQGSEGECEMQTEVADCDG
jgi:hypothetical protein